MKNQEPKTYTEDTQERKTRDITESQIISDIIKEKILPAMSEIKEFKHVKYETKEEKQLQNYGADIIITLKDGSVIYVDEKAVLKYSHDKNICKCPKGSPKRPQTFNSSLELAMTCKNKVNQYGWFINNNQIATHYLLITPTLKEVDKLTSKEQVIDLDVYLVEKAKLKEYLKAFKTNDKYDNIYDYGKILASTFIGSKTQIDTKSYYKGKDRVFFYHTPSYVFEENPLNIVLPNSLIDELSLKRFKYNNLSDNLEIFDYQKLKAKEELTHKIR